MRYRGSLTIPAGTTEDDPAVETVSLCYGDITEIEIMFPAGHAGLTHLQIWHHERQAFPTSPGEAFRGDDHVIEFPERYPVREVPYQIELRGWAPGAAYDHTVYVEITVAAPQVLPEVTGRTVALPEGMVL